MNKGIDLEEEGNGLSEKGIGLSDKRIDLRTKGKDLFNKIVRKRPSIGRTTNDQHAEEPK
ncbi:MAG TPA: hypothetical protein VL093_06255 [Flavipsychrobacter sp.]|nr:hypothetical protein [Flavipsychrobacter sp.]